MTFSEARAERRAMVERHKAERDALQAEYDAAMSAAYAVSWPKRKKLTNAREVALAKGGYAVIEAARGPFDERARDMIDRQTAEAEAADKRLDCRCGASAHARKGRIKR